MVLSLAHFFESRKSEMAMKINCEFECQHWGAMARNRFQEPLRREHLDKNPPEKTLL